MQPMNRRSRHRHKFKRPKISLKLFFFIILMIVMIGTLTGAFQYLNQPYDVREDLRSFIAIYGLNRQSFFNILNASVREQLVTWGLGLTIIGPVVSGAVLFSRSSISGFTMSFLAHELVLNGSGKLLILWLIQHFLKLLISILGVYFSVRFSYIAGKRLMKKQYQKIILALQKYVMQLVFLLVLTTFTSMLSAIILPFIVRRF